MKGGSSLEELLQHCCQETGADRETVEKVVNTFLDGIVSELSQGNTVNLGEDFGTFSAAFRDGGNVQANSPRTPKQSRYLTVFRENKGMKRRMVIPAEQMR
jgi:nucleoid DNA-binding protein